MGQALSYLQYWAVSQSPSSCVDVKPAAGVTKHTYWHPERDWHNTVSASRLISTNLTDSHR